MVPMYKQNTIVFQKTLTVVYSWRLLFWVNAICQKETTMHTAHNTPHDAEIQAQLCAYNCAFDDLGLRFRWDARTLAMLAMIDGEEARITAYIEAHHAHLLNAYSAGFLSRAILERKNARYPACLPTRGESAPSTDHVASQQQIPSQREHIAYEVELPALAGV
jgi:hypothetical protein